MLGWNYNKILYIICVYRKQCHFSNFFLSTFIIHIKKRNWVFFLVNFYPSTLQKVFISCRNSMVEFWGHFCILSYHNSTLASSFSILLSCSPLVVGLKVQYNLQVTILNRQGESGSLVPDFSGIALYFFLYNSMLTIGMLCIANMLCIALGMNFVSVISVRLLS